MTKNDIQKQKVVIALKKARTSLDKILSNIEREGNSDKKCFDIIQQNLAVIGLLKSANISILENHLDMYIDNASKGVKQKKELQKMKDEIVKIVVTAQKK
ncbi:MAG: metal-sensing transcriptional repressor [Candidatus Moraniibacteriota bacterium]|jgi:DNA-binding FrmR family transcriptional regulator